jgi:predicted PurR-regulated permease PerM/methanogenic corrinoid protein MtbC1
VAAESDTYRLLKPFVVLATVTLAVVILGWAKVVLVPLALAVLFTFLLSPPVIWLRRKGVPRWPAALLVTGLACVLVVAAFWIVTLQLRDLIVELPTHSQTINAKITSLGNDEGDGFIRPAIKAVQDLYSTVQSNLSAGGDSIPEVRIHSDYPSTILGMAQPVLETVVGLLLILVLVVFMLVYREDLQYRLIQLVGHGHLTTTTHALYETAERTSKFLMTQAVINIAFGVVLALGLYLLPVEGLFGGFGNGVTRDAAGVSVGPWVTAHGAFGGVIPRHVPYAFLWGFLAALLRFIPYIGTWVALLFPLTLSVAVFPGWWPPLEVLIFYIALELTIANFVEPLMLSHSTGVSPIALLVAAAFWTWLWGPVGLLLSTPLTVCLSVLGRYIPSLSFLHTVLGSEPVLNLSNRFYQRLLALDPDEAGDIIEEAVKKEPLESVYDRVIIPALSMLRRDSQRGEVNDDLLRKSLRTINEILEELEPLVKEAAGGHEAAAKAGACVLGCTAGDEIDEVALQMLRVLVEAAGYSMTVASSDKLSAEVVAEVSAEKPAVVCLASLPPGGVSRASYLCKRLRGKSPDLHILVGRWGQDDLVSARQRLQAAGANTVANSLYDTRKELIPLLQHFSSCAQPTAAAEGKEKREPAATR